MSNKNEHVGAGAAAVFLVVALVFGGLSSIAISSFIPHTETNIALESPPASYSGPVHNRYNHSQSQFENTSWSEYYMSNVNLAPLSVFYEQVDYYSVYTGDMGYETTPANMHLGHATIWQRDNPSGWNEINGAWISVNPGDRIVYSVWAKTSSGAYNNYNLPYSGARLGMDFGLYGGGYVYTDYLGNGGWTPGHPCDHFGENAYNNIPPTFRLPWGNSGWTLLEWDINVPTDWYSFMEEGGNIIPITPHQIEWVGIWLDVRDGLGAGVAWFSDSELYVQPDVIAQLPAPTYNPVAGTYMGGQNIVISDSVPNSSIYYTVDGSTPGSGDALYTAPVAVGVGSTTLKAFAKKTGYYDSAVETAQYLVYVAQYFTVQIMSGSGGYTVPSGSRQVLVGQSLSVTAYPNQNYTFRRWLLNNLLYSTQTTVSISGNANTVYVLQPEYTAQYFTLQIMTGVGGSTSPTGIQQVFAGQSLSVTATPSIGYTFRQWLLNNLVYSAQATVSVSGNANTVYVLQPEFTADVEPDPVPTIWTLNLSADSHGSTLPAVGVILVDTLSLVVTAIPIATYRFRNWLLDGALSVSNPLTITTTFGSTHTLYARFEPDVGIHTDPDPNPTNPSVLFQNNVAYLETVNVPTFQELVEEIRRRTV